MRRCSARSPKQQLAAIRMLFDWLVTGQVVPTNPAAAVRGPKHIVKTGVTSVLVSIGAASSLGSALVPALSRLQAVVV